MITVQTRQMRASRRNPLQQLDLTLLTQLFLLQLSASSDRSVKILA